MKTLRALLVGINDYQHQRNLSGCLNDVARVDTYLSGLVPQAFESYAPLKLVNEAATREKLIAAFQSHFIEQAQPEDVCLFHFSGHGGQEEAHEAFLPYEPDGKLEGLVCHDTGSSGVPTLADKELRFLIHQLAEKGCEILCIFDCCHAGDSTRIRRQDLQERRISADIPARRWEQFIFSSVSGLENPEPLAQTPMDRWLPVGKHIQLAACLDYESAYECNFEDCGFFTRTLIETLLHSRNSLSYLELMRRVHSVLHAQQVPQRPQVYASAGNYGQIMRAFLVGIPIDEAMVGHITYDIGGKGWLIDLGALHGLSTSAESPVPVVVDLEQDLSSVAYIQRVYTDYAQIEFPKREVAPNPEKSYTGRISGLMMGQTAVYLTGEAEGVKPLQDYWEANHHTLSEQGIHLVSQEAEANYVIRVEENAYRLTLPQDSRPLIKRTMGYSERSVGQVVKKLQHISRWNFIRLLKNPAPTLIPPYPLQLTLRQEGGGEQVIGPQAGPIRLAFAEEAPPRYYFRFTNQSGLDLSVACLYLSQQFGVQVDFFQPKVLQLERGQSVWTLNGAPLELRKPAYLDEFGWKEEVIYFLLIVSTEAFEVDLFALPELDAPIRQHRGFVRPEEDAPRKSWATQLFEFRVE